MSISQTRTGLSLKWLNSSRLHVLLFCGLLVATPFFMVTRYLQEAIGQLSLFSITIAGLDLPVIFSFVCLFVLAALIVLRHQITKLRIAAAIVVLLMITLAQQITDYYFDHTFYDLQQNWHYIAYGLFAAMLFRDLAPRGIPQARILLITFLAAVACSTFDEGFQRHLSSRTFDLSDIAKDACGAVMGMAAIYLGENRTGAILRNWGPIRHRRLRDYLRHGASVLVLCALLTLLFLCFGSVLSEEKFGGLVVLFTVVTFLVLFNVIHLTQFRLARRILLAVLIVALSLQALFYVKHRNDHIVHQGNGLVVYKGVPIPFFDLMIFPDGGFRLVDKKEDFYARDRQAFMKQRADIILIGSGAHGAGGRGFPSEAIHQFNYNFKIERGSQIIILKNPEACRLFNRLKGEGKNVLFIIHHEI